MLTISISGGGVERALAAIAERIGNTRPVMKMIAEILDDRVSENFLRESGPLGEWPAIKPPKNKTRTNPKILQDTARLKNSITTTYTNNTAQVGTNVVYAAIHQLGGEINIPARSQQAYFKQRKDGSVGNRFVRKSASNFSQWHTRGAHTIEMPARPFLPFANGKLQDGLERDILDDLAGYILHDARR